jgi:anti-sigma B factor antagonist
MDISANEVDGTSVVSISGSLDALTSAQMTSFMSEQITGGRRAIVADLSQVDFMSSAGLRAILITTKEVRRQGGDFRLAAAQSGVGKVLEMSGFTGIVKTFPTVESALASFNEGRQPEG